MGAGRWYQQPGHSRFDATRPAPWHNAAHDGAHRQWAVGMKVRTGLLLGLGIGYLLGTSAQVLQAFK